MAFGAFVREATPVDISGTSATIGGAGFAANVTAGNLLVLAVRVGATGRTVTVTSDSTPTPFTLAVTQAQTADAHQTYIYHGINQAGGVKPTITVGIDGASASMRLLLCEYEASANTEKDQTASAEDNSSGVNAISSGATGTRAADAELQIGVMSLADDAGVEAEGTGFTLRALVTNKVYLEDVVRTAAGTQAATFSTTTTQPWACLTATYKDEAGGAVDSNFIFSRW